MVRAIQRLAIASFIWATVAGAAFAQTAIPGLYLSGTPPTGFTQQNLMFHCTTPGTCPGSNAWPLVELFNSGGLNSLTNPIFISPATSATFTVTLPTGASTAALQPAINGDGGALAHVTNFPTTQPVSAASLPLPTGAATSAKQPNVAAQGATTSGMSGTLSMGAVTTAVPSWTDGQTEPLSIDSANGALRVEGGTAGGPLGTQAISNSQAVNPATSSIWNTSNAADLVATGTIFAADTASVCSATGWSGQTICTGVPTANSTVSATISANSSVSVQGVISGGTATEQFEIQISVDGGVHWVNRGLYIQGGSAPSQVNGLTANFLGFEPAGYGMIRVQAVTFTTLTGTPIFNVTITQGIADPYTIVTNLPASSTGFVGTSAVNAQGNGPTALPFNTNFQQQAGLTLAAPTAPGSPATSGLVPTVNFAGTVTSTVSGFAPNGNTLPSAVSVGSSASAAALLPLGTTVLFSNTGSNVEYVRIGNGSVVATANDIPIQGGSGCALAVGANLDYSAISPAGSTLNAVGGTGLGNCPSGGGGGSGGASGNVFQVTNAVNGTICPSGCTVVSNTTTQVIAASGTQTIYLISYAEQTDAAAGSAATFQIISGGGVNCATSPKTLTTTWNFTANNGTSRGNLGTLNLSNPGDELCVKTTTANQVNYEIGVAQQ